MNKKIIALTSATGAMVALYTAVDLVAYHEIFHTNAVILRKINEKQKKRVPKKLQQKEDELAAWTRSRTFQDFEITDKKGRKLKGLYYPAKEESKTFVLCSHGYRSRGRGEFRFVSKFHHDCGHNILLVDHPGAGESDGKYISFGKNESEGLYLWIEFLREKFGDDINIILHGISMGSASVMLLSSDNRILPNVKFIIADCGYTSVEDQFRSVLKAAKVPAFPLLNTVFATNRLVQHFSLKEIQPIEQVKKSLVPILFIHGGRDNFVPTEMVYKLYDACTSEKDLLVVDGAGHGASYKKNPPAYEEKVKTFIEKYIK